MNKEQALLSLIRSSQNIIRLKRSILRTGALDALNREYMLFIVHLSHAKGVLTLDEILSCPTIKAMIGDGEIK